MFKCLLRLVHDFFPFFSMNMADSSSCNVTSCFNGHPCASMNNWWDSVLGEQSATPTNYASVELVVLNFCFEDFDDVNPMPCADAPPV